MTRRPVLLGRSFIFVNDLDQRLSELMARAQEGDRAAYALLLGEAAGLLRAFVRPRLRETAHVDDVVQDTLLAIHQYRHTYDPARPFRPWMYAIARHRLLDLVHRERRHTDNELGDVALDTLETAAHTSEPEAPGALQRALALLTETQRAVICKLKIEGYSVAEISRETGMSESAVKVTAHRGYKALRKLL